MQAVLDKQNNSLKRLEELSKQDRLLQLIQVKELLSVDDDTTEMIDELKNINTNLTLMFGEIKKSVVNVDMLALQELATKNSMSLPQISREINVSRQNLQELVRGGGGEVKTGADMQFRKSSEQESLMKNEIAERSERIASSGANIITVGNDLSAEESSLEESRENSKQTELLRKIEENTRQGGIKGEPKPAGQKQEENKSGGLLDLFKAGGLKRAGAGLLRGAASIAKRAPGIAAGAAIISGVGGAFLGHARASNKEKQAHEEIEQRVASGEITPEQGEQLKAEATKTGRVEKSGAIGGGAGSVGGALLGMKGGAIAGAKIGAFLGPKGAIVGGLLGGTVGAVSGSKVGQQIGEFAGKTTGRIRNFFAGGDKNEERVKLVDGDAVDAKPSLGTRVLDATSKAIPVVGMARSAVKAASNFFAGGKEVSDFSPQQATGVSPEILPKSAVAPSSGDIVSKSSSETEQAKMEANRPAGPANIVAAPTTINNQTIQNNAAPKLPPRNSDHTVNKYLESRYA